MYNEIIDFFFKKSICAVEIITTAIRWPTVDLLLLEIILVLALMVTKAMEKIVEV